MLLLGVGSGRAGGALRQQRLQWSNLLPLKSWETWQLFCAQVQKYSIFVMLSLFFLLVSMIPHHLVVQSLNHVFQIAGYILKFCLLRNQTSPSVQDLSKTAGKSLQAKITENTKSTWTTKNKVGIQCSVLHSLSTTIKLAQYRWDPVRAFETSSYILQCAAKLAGLAPVLLWSWSQEKSNSRNESCVCWYSECCRTCWSIAAACTSVSVCSGVNICITSLCLHGGFGFLCLYKLVLKAGTSHFWSCESCKFHPSTLPAIHSCTQQEQVNKPSVTGRKAKLLCSCVSFLFSSVKDPI